MRCKFKEAHAYLDNKEIFEYENIRFNAQPEMESEQTEFERSSIRINGAKRQHRQ